MNRFLKISLASVGVVALSVGALSFLNTFSVAEDKKANFDRAAIEQIVEEYIANNPDKIVDALNSFQRLEQQRAEEASRQALVEHKDYFVNNKELPAIGAEKPRVTVVEFFDYNCGYCKRAFDDVMKIMADYNDVRVVFVEMPILSEASNVAARMALALDKQGKYFAFHESLMKASGALNEARMEQFAKDIGADIDKMKEDMKSPDIERQIRQNREKAALVGVRGTPGFIIGDDVIRGAIGHQAMKEYIDRL